MSSPASTRLQESVDRVASKAEQLGLHPDLLTCVHNRRVALEAEFAGPAGERVWDLIGLPLVEVVNVECNPVPVADHYWAYRRDLEAAGDLDTLSRFHQYVDGVYVYIVSGLTDLSGFDDVAGYRIEREAPRFEAASLTWLTIAGLHAYGLGPSARRELEATDREAVMQRLSEIATALRTSEYFGPSSARFARSSSEYACVLEKLSNPMNRPRYFTQSDVKNFLDTYRFDSLVRDRGWADLWADTQREWLGSGEAEQVFADQVFQGLALADFSTEVRSTVERSANTWIDDDDQIDYSRVRHAMDTVAFDLEAARQFLIAKVGPGLALEGQALDGAFVLHEGIRKSESDVTSPYSCFPSPVAP